MKVLRFRKHWKVELTDEPEPQPAPGEVSVEFDAVGICGSDVHGFAGITDRRKPGAAPDRIALAAELGHVVPDPTDDLDPWMAPNGGPVEVAFDAVGTDESVAEALACTRPDGAVVEIGLGVPTISITLQLVVPLEEAAARLETLAYGKESVPPRTGQPLRPLSLAPRLTGPAPQGRSSPHPVLRL